MGVNVGQQRMPAGPRVVSGRALDLSGKRLPLWRRGVVRGNAPDAPGGPWQAGGKGLDKAGVSAAMGAFAGGFIKGLLVGLGAFALGFTVLSVVLPPAPEADDPRVTTPATEPGTPSAEADAPGPSDSAPALPSLVTPDTPGAQAPATAAEPDSPDAPQTPASPDVPGDGAAADADLAADHQPADTETRPAPAVPDLPALPGAEPADAPNSLQDQPADPAAPAMADLAPAQITPPERAADALPRIAEVPPMPEPPAEPLPGPDAAPSEEPAAAEADEQAPVPSDPAPEEPAITPVEPDGDTPDTPVPSAQIVRPAPGLPQAVEGVVTGRLPRVGAAEDNTGPAAPAVDDPTALPIPEEPEAEVEAGTDQPAHSRFAAAFEVDPARPHLAIILLDTAPTPETEAALLALEFPLSIAIDPADPDATRRATAYREAGHEVLIFATGLPTRATAADIEVTFTDWSATLPQAAALLDPANGGMRANAALARVAAPALADRGLGLFLASGGLGGARQAARAAGVVTGEVFRDIDEGLEARHTIRRYLDRAVFEAQRQGSVIVLGRADHAETLEALALWRSEGRAGEVTYGPAAILLTLD